MRFVKNWGQLGMKYKLGDISIINPRETIKKELLRKKLTWLFCNHSREKSHLLNCWNIKAELNLEMVIQ